MFKATLQSAALLIEIKITIVKITVIKMITWYEFTFELQNLTTSTFIGKLFIFIICFIYFFKMYILKKSNKNHSENLFTVNCAGNGKKCNQF